MPRAAAIFQETESPRDRRRNRINAVARWWTWSDGFRSALPGLLREAREAGYSPRTARVPGLGRYDYTFSALHCAAGKRIAGQFVPWTGSLRNLKPGPGIMLLTGLLLPGMDSGDLRLLYTALRDALCPSTTDPSGALYAPLGDTGGAPSEFPLHCDLYIPWRLWNVFDDVSSTGRSGASVFLRTRDMLMQAAACELPASDRRQLRECLQSAGRDRYEEFYTVLYADSAAHAALDRRMRAMSYRINLRRGEGYMIHDRVWMHGRTMTSRSVTRNRLHRLTF